MKLKCKACGNTEKFYGWQRVEGYVLVSADGDGNRLDIEGNAADDLDWYDAEGPWTCANANCESKDVEELEE